MIVAANDFERARHFYKEFAIESNVFDCHVKKIAFFKCVFLSVYRFIESWDMAVQSRKIKIIHLGWLRPLLGLITVNAVKEMESNTEIRSNVEYLLR